ncbi:MAG: DUF2069 domain-containing protein [Comamonadaceae bacterium]|nr:DUF2069 domain-containing protein [Comamonadaceae bacterium]
MQTSTFPHSKTPTASVAATRVLAVSSLLGLIVLGLAWELWLAPIRPGGSWLALKVLPLCLPLAGLLKNRMYTYRWVSLMVWLYFSEGVVRGFSDRPPGNWLGMVEVALCLLLFVACALHVRLRLRHQHPPAEEDSSHANPA